MYQDGETINFNEPSSEDTVQCFFFAPANYTEKDMEDFCKTINNTIASIATDYFWHKDEFKVFLPLNEKSREDMPLHLASRTCYGDNIEDEWFIVHIIMELTKRFKNVVVQIKDNDGDFILIEAADYLPSWANPESTNNRVFIFNSHIHLIPPSQCSLEQKLKLKDALQLIINFSKQTQVSEELEQAIANRIGNYPQKSYDNMHNALVKIPLDLAVLLKLKPKLIAPIVDAYCHHDVIDAKSFRNISFDHWITVNVKLTKCLYAMLAYSKVVGGIKQHNEKDKKNILGMKLTCGFQIIMKKSSDIYDSKEYIHFIKSLNGNGYFKNNIEGSEQYNKLLKNAKDFFSTVKCPMPSYVSSVITELMTTEEYIDIKEHLKNEGSTIESTEDSDEWLTVHPEQLNELLNSRYGKKTKFKKGDVLTPQAITSELKGFLKETSDFEGIETHNQEVSENHIDFDPDEFVNCVEKMLKILSSNNENYELESIDSDFDDDAMSQSDSEGDIDKELKEKLHGAAEDLSDNKIILDNIVKSIKEEKASMGPSSNLITILGFNKTDFFDSDDD